MSRGTVTLDIAGAIARIILDHPARHNALSLAMWRAIPEHVAAAAANPEVRVIVVTGAGEKAFCSGADISQFSDNRADADASAAYDEAVHTALAALRGVTKPTVAAIRGICFGGGLEIALCCDLRIACSNARFRIPAGRLGLGYGYRDVALLYERLGAKPTSEILFTAAIVDAQKALADGILHRVFAADVFALEAEAYVASIATNAPLVLRAMKLALIELEKPAHERDVAVVDHAARACVSSDDYREGQAAFREKREPHFTGQ